MSLSTGIFFSSIIFPCSLVFIWDLTLRAQGIDWDSRKKLSRKPSDPGPLNASAVWETVHRLPRCFPRFSIPHDGFQAMNLAIGWCTSVLENVSDYPPERLFEISQTFETTQPWSIFPDELDRNSPTCAIPDNFGHFGRIPTLTKLPLGITSSDITAMEYHVLNHLQWL